MTNRYFHKYLPALVLLFAGVAPAQDSTNNAASPAAPHVQTSASPIDTASSDSADKMVENFFALLGKGQIDQAYDYLTNGTKIAESPDEVANLKSRTRDAVKVFGDIHGYELVNVQNAGTHLMRATYLSLGKESPLRWKFYFYKTDQGWKLIDIGVDDRLVDMFDDAKPLLQTGSSR